MRWQFGNEQLPEKAFITESPEKLKKFGTHPYLRFETLCKGESLIRGSEVDPTDLVKLIL